MSNFLFRISLFIFLILFTNLIKNHSANAMLGNEGEIITVAYTKVMMRNESSAKQQLHNDLNNNTVDWNQFVAETKQDPYYVERGYGKRTRHRPVAKPAPKPVHRCGHCGVINCRQSIWCTHHRQHHSPNPWCSHHGEHHDENPWCTHCGVHTHGSDPWCTTCNIHHTVAEHATIEEAARQEKITKAKGALVSDTASKQSDLNKIKEDLDKKPAASTSSSFSGATPNSGGLIFEDDL